MVENMSDSQAQTDQIAILNNLVNLLSALANPVGGPAIIAGTYYTRKEVERRMEVGHETIDLWLSNGLPISKPGTRSGYISGSRLITFLDEHPTLKRPANYKERQALREKRRKSP